MLQEPSTPISRLVLVLYTLGAVACQVPHIPDEELPTLTGELGSPGLQTNQAPAPVSRQAAIQLARRYASERWTPTKRNAWHGYDENGIRVDSPDHEFRAPGLRPGWWKPGEENQGIPYQWGGFSTLAEFQQGIQNGASAGDILTEEKRAMLAQGLPTVSPFAVGIDSSGLISRCWKLDRNYTTRELENMCEVLESYDDLKPGDALNLPGVHVILFEQFESPNRKALLGYEAGAPPSWKVLYDHLPVSHLKRLGYRPLRLRHITEAANDAEVLGLKSALTPTPPAPLVEPPISVMDRPDAPFL